MHPNIGNKLRYDLAGLLGRPCGEALTASAILCAKFNRGGGKFLFRSMQTTPEAPFRVLRGNEKWKKFKVHGASETFRKPFMVSNLEGPRCVMRQEEMATDQ
jgi:hypothetical protein